MFEYVNRTQIYLPKTKIEKIRKIALKRRTTVSAIVRELLDQALEEPRTQHKERTYETLTEAAKRINAHGKKGPKDLASRLDFYLYGKI